MMETSEHHTYVSCRSLETQFPRAIKSIELVSLRGPSNIPILQQAVRFHSGPWRAAVKSHVIYNEKQEAFHRWQNEYKQREQNALHHSSSQLLRETAWYDPSLPSQQLQDSPRWGTFLWKDQHVPGKEFVLNRHKFGIKK
ncbi:tektin bundle-interacting protein 1 [Pseudophryne corroboree]|uniref:tektin bundle-interacting protein 1 n=1 Tax=Pseudophryne corroboree TaxID=495146 RepID=UPI003081537E